MINNLVQAWIFVFHCEQGCSGDLFPETNKIKDSNSPPYLKFEHIARETKSNGSGNLFTCMFILHHFLKLFTFIDLVFLLLNIVAVQLVTRSVSATANTLDTLNYYQTCHFLNFPQGMFGTSSASLRSRRFKGKGGEAKAGEPFSWFLDTVPYMYYSIQSCQLRLFKDFF